MSAPRELVLDGERLGLTSDPKGVTIESGGTTRRIEYEVLAEAPGELRLRLCDRNQRVRWVRAGNEILVAVEGETYRFSPAERVGRGRGKAGVTHGRIAAPMPGAVIQVLVTEGAVVAVGTDLVVVEAMKMEHRLRAPFAGTVCRLTAAVGKRCALGEILLEIEAVLPPA